MTRTQVLEQFIPVKGGQIYLKRWLPTEVVDQSPMILFHDSLGCVDTWRDFPLQLAEKIKREVIAYDRLGFGRSSARSCLPSIRFIKEEGEVDFAEIVKALHIDKYSLFGHSVGGAMALTIAGLYPEKCNAVISESAQVFVEERTRQGILAALKEFKNPAVFAKLQKYHQEKASWVLNAWSQVWLSTEFANWKLESELQNIKCKTLVIHGDQDEFGSEKFPDEICRSIQCVVVKKLIKDCGHVPHREKSEMILDLIYDFFNTAA